MERFKKSLKPMITFGIALIAVVIALIFALLVRVKSPEPEEYNYIKEKARELNFNVDSIISYVEKNLRDEKYDGYLRGAIGTLWAGEGNDIDRSVLARELLKYSGVKTRLVRDERGYFVEYKKDGLWARIFRSAEGDRRKAEVVGAVPEALRHRLKVTVSVSLDGVSYKDDIVFETDTAAFVYPRNFLEFKKNSSGAIRSALTCAGSIFTGKEDVASAKKMFLVFDVYSPNAQPRTYKRVIFDTDRRVGHRAPHLNDKFIFAVLPGFVNSDILETEEKLYKARKDKKDIAAKVQSMNYLMCISFAVFSDINTRTLLKELNGNACLTSPRIIVASTEIEQVLGREVAYQTLDLLKNDIEVTTPNSIEVRTARGAGDNILEGLIIEIFTGKEPITTTELFNRLAGENFGYEYDTVAKRIALFKNNLEKLNAEKGSAAIVISSGGKAITVKKLFKKDSQDKGVLGIFTDEKSKEGKAHQIDCAGKSLDDIAFVMEEIFLKKYGMELNYQPQILREAAADVEKGIVLTDTNKIVYRIKAQEKEYILTAYLRKRGKNSWGYTKYRMDWVSEAGGSMGSAGVELPSYSVFNVKDFTFNSTLTEFGGGLSFGQFTKVHTLVHNDEVKADEYRLSFNGSEIMLPAKTISDGKGTEVWFVDDSQTRLVVKVEEPGYSQEIVSIDNGERGYIVSGKVIDKKVGRGVDNAALSLVNSKKSTTSWGDGSFEIQLADELPFFDHSVLILIDDSGSMKDPLKADPNGPSKLKLAQEAASYLVDRLPKNTEVAGFGFYFEAYSHYLTVDRNAVKNTLANLTGWSGTPLTSSVKKLVEIMRTNGRGRHQRIILLSDGENTEKGDTMVDAYKKCDYSVPFYTVGFDIEAGGKAEKELKDIAEASGGRYVRAETFKELEATFAEFSQIPIEEKKDILTVVAHGYEDTKKEVSLTPAGTPCEFELSRLDTKTDNKAVMISKENLEEMESLNISRQAKNLIREIVLSGDGMKALVPREMIDTPFGWTIGWWEINTVTGELIGRTEDGLRGSTSISLLPQYDPERKEFRKSIEKGKETGKKIREFADKASWALDGKEAGELKKYGSFVAGMYAQSAGVLNAVGYLEIDGAGEGLSLGEWMKTADAKARRVAAAILARAGGALTLNVRYYMAGANCVSGIFMHNLNQVLLEELVELAKYEFKERVIEPVKEKIKETIKKEIIEPVEEAAEEVAGIPSKLE